MDMLIHFIIGSVFVPLFNHIKRWLGVTDIRAAWLVAIILLLISIPAAIAANAFAGFSFDLSEPLAFLESVAKAFLVLLGTAQGWYMLYYKRAENGG